MGRIRSRVVSKAPVAELYRLGREVHSFTAMFPNLKEIKLLECSEDGCYVKSEWTAQAKLITQTRSMTWVQEDRWDHDSKCCRFTCSSDNPGRFKKLDGTWFFKPHHSGAEMIMDVDFEIDHPLMNPIVAKIIDNIMKMNNEHMLKVIKQKAESGE
ncbi:MAG TPA: SRPBCC family protein [bacterium]|nr:SRPBCC family protein [bacterium]